MPLTSRSTVSTAGARSGAGRVIAGTARGIRLLGPGDGTRPLGDRMKQSLFAILEPEIRDGVFVDLYAGSGAAGIEALSRGAARAIFVERHARAVESVRRNLEATGLAGRAVIVRAPVGDWLSTARRSELASGGAEVVFVDPPYGAPAEVDGTLSGIEAAGPGGIVASAGAVVVKHFWKTELPETRLLRSVRSERFGDTVLTFFRWAEEVAL
jgi:16S rRNA (guanine(966)-N(2))-methyltransferase RsmD